jgi:hypothetical protein
MVFQVPQFWDIAGDGFQIILCLLMLGFYVKNRAIQKKSTVGEVKSITGQNFNTQIFSITIEQQLNKAFANIVETITVERSGLENLLGLNPLNHENDEISMIQVNSPFPDVNGNQRSLDDRIESTGRHDKVRKLAAKGLTVSRISKELRISMSEVELILSLREN